MSYSSTDLLTMTVLQTRPAPGQLLRVRSLITAIADGTGAPALRTLPGEVTRLLTAVAHRARHAATWSATQDTHTSPLNSDETWAQH